MTAATPWLSKVSVAGALEVTVAVLMPGHPAREDIADIVKDPAVARLLGLQLEIAEAGAQAALVGLVVDDEPNALHAGQLAIPGQRHLPLVLVEEIVNPRHGGPPVLQR